MSEPLAEHLSRFTPDATGLDRDTLLFAAGLASVRTNRNWQALAGALALSQALTLVILWPRTPSSPPSVPVIASNLSRAESRPAPLPEPDPSEWSVLRQHLFDADFDKLTPPSEEPMVPPEPPLHAYGPLPSSLLN